MLFLTGVKVENGVVNYAFDDIDVLHGKIHVMDYLERDWD